MSVDLQGHSVSGCMQANEDVESSISLLSETGPIAIPVSCLIKRAVISVQPQVSMLLLSCLYGTSTCCRSELLICSACTYSIIVQSQWSSSSAPPEGSLMWLMGQTVFQNAPTISLLASQSRGRTDQALPQHICQPSRFSNASRAPFSCSEVCWFSSCTASVLSAVHDRLI